MRNSLTIGIVGTGGDGVIVLGTFLQKLAAAQGYFSQMPRYYGAQIRGGASAVKLGLNAEHLCLPEDTTDVMVCFDFEKYRELAHELPMGDGTLALYDGDPPEDMDLPRMAFRVDFSKKSREVTGTTVSKNMVALGLLKKILGLPEDGVKRTMEEDEELVLLTQNVPAVAAGEQLFSGFSLPELQLSPPRDTSPKVILHGNGAVAQAAIRAGCRAFFGYPITPASEIMQDMQEGLSQMGGVFLQAEDEITAAGLLVGASLAGVESMTATSGPGLDLMTEMLGLASAAEIPIVIVNVQRCGPSTGIPSRSEQSDLNHAIYGGHGDAPRVVIAPYDLEGCYRLVIESINIARGYQVPVILLSDQWLGQTLVATDREFLERDYPRVDIKRPVRKQLEQYFRYELTGNSVSPMAAAGDAGFVYQTTGLTHGEQGTPAFDFHTHQTMHEKRWQKLMPLCQRDELVKLFGEPEYRRGIVTWGSSAQIVLETVRELGLEDKVKVCVPELIYPLPDIVESFVKSCDKLLVIEMNYSSQFYHYLRSLVDLPEKTGVYSRAGGRPFSKEELAGPISETAK